MTTKDKRLTFNTVALLMIGLAVLGVYLQTLTHDFVNFDDEQYVTQNEWVTSGITLENMGWAFTNISHMCWQPLTWLSHMLDCQIAGLNPAWPHAHNMLLHLANSMILFVLFHTMTGARWRSFFLAMLFAIHPLGVDTVAWISERKNLLSALFLLLTLLAYQHYARFQKVRSYLIALACFCAGLFSKPSVITLPCVLLLMDVWPLGRFPGGRESLGSGGNDRAIRPFGRLVIEKIPFFLLSALYLWIFTFSLGQMQATVGLDKVAMHLRLSNAMVSYVHYLWHVVWPQGLAVYYPFPQTIPNWQVVSASVFVLAVTSGALLAAKQRPYFLVGWFWFLGTLVPTIGIIQAGLWPARADRWVYIPMIGVLVIIVWGSRWFFNRIGWRDRLAAVVATVLLVAYASVAHLQTQHWRDSVTLFQRAVAVTDDNFVAHDNLGLGLAMQGRFDQAYKHFNEAIRIKPQFWKAHQNLGAIYLIKSEYDRAIRHFEIALSGSPHSVRIHLNLGRAYAGQGKKKKAEDSFRKAIALEPGNQKAVAYLHKLTGKPLAN